MVQNNLMLQFTPNTVQNSTGQAEATTEENGMDAFGQLIAQMFSGMIASTEGGQQNAGLNQAQVQQLQCAGLKMDQILQIQQLQPTDLQLLQGESSLPEAEQTTEGSTLLELLELLKNMRKDSGEDAVVESLCAALQSDSTQAAAKEEDGTSETSETNAALLELIAELLRQSQNTDTAAAQETASGTVASIAAQNVTAVVQGAGTPRTAEARQTQQTMQQAHTDNTAQTEVTVQSTAAGTKSDAQAQTQSSDSQKQLFALQSSFRDAVAKAKDQLQTDAKDTETIDVDALQAQVATNRDLTLRFTSTPAAEDTQKAELPVATQIQNGVTENLKLGKTEFTIKLHPESLGEITIKLTETDGKTTLQMFAASAETARTINNDLNALREAVRPMAVEVHEAVTQSAQSGNAGTNGFDLGSQFAQQQQRQQHWTAPQSTSTNYEELVTQENAEGTESVQALDSSGLDTYI